MKREERRMYNQTKKLTFKDNTICVDVSIWNSSEYRNAMHELLTFRGFYASCISWTVDDSGYAVHYVPATTTEADHTRQIQECLPVEDVAKWLKHSDYAWNGHKRPEGMPEKW